MWAGGWWASNPQEGPPGAAGALAGGPGAVASPWGAAGSEGRPGPAPARGAGGREPAHLGRQHTRLLRFLLEPPARPRATHSFIIGLLLLELLHHDAPLLILAPFVLKPDPDHTGTEAGHLHELLLHERIGPGVGGVAGPQGVQLLLVQHSPHAGGLLGLLVDVGPQGRLPGGDGLGCGARGAVSAGRAARLPTPIRENGTMASALRPRQTKQRRQRWGCGTQKGE